MKFFAVFLVLATLAIPSYALVGIDPPKFTYAGSTLHTRESLAKAGEALYIGKNLSVYKIEKENYVEATNELEIASELYFVMGTKVLAYRMSGLGKIESAHLVLSPDDKILQVIQIKWQTDHGRWEYQVTSQGESDFMVRDSVLVEFFTWRTTYYDHVSKTGWTGAVSFSFSDNLLRALVQRYFSYELSSLYLQTEVGYYTFDPGTIGTILPTYSNLGFLAILGENFKPVLGLNDTRVNLREAPGVTSKVLTLLGGDEELRLLDISYKKDQVQGRTGYWVNVSAGSQVGWVWSDYLQTDFSILPLKRYLSGRGNNTPPYSKEEIRKFVQYVKDKDLRLLKGMLEAGFAFGTDVGFNGVRAPVYLIGLQSSDEVFMVEYLKIIFQNLGNLHSFEPAKALYYDVNPLVFSILQRNKTGIDAVLRFRPDFMNQFTADSGSVIPPPIVVAIKANDLEITKYLLAKGFDPKWVYEQVGEYSRAPGDLPGNLITWATTSEMTKLLLAAGVPDFIAFKKPWKEKILSTADLYVKLGGTPVTVKADGESVIVLGILAQSQLDTEDKEGRAQIRYFRILYKNAEYFVRTNSLDIGRLWDH